MVGASWDAEIETGFWGLGFRGVQGSGFRILDLRFRFCLLELLGREVYVVRVQFLFLCARGVSRC